MLLRRLKDDTWDGRVAQKGVELAADVKLIEPVDLESGGRDRRRVRRTGLR